MTPEQADEEVFYRREERLGIMANGKEPTEQQKKIARQESMAWLKANPPDED